MQQKNFPKKSYSSRLVHHDPSGPRGCLGTNVVPLLPYSHKVSSSSEVDSSDSGSAAYAPSRSSAVSVSSLNSGRSMGDRPSVPSFESSSNSGRSMGARPSARRTFGSRLHQVREGRWVIVLRLVMFGKVDG